MAPSAESAADRWRQRATAQGLLLQRPKLHSLACMTAYSETGRHCGVSLHYLRALADSLAGEPCDGTTSAVLHRYLLPALAKQACKKRLWDLIPAEHTGMPEWYVCHDWSESLQDLVSAVEADLSPKTQPTQQTLGEGLGHDVFVWLDLFAVNHYSPSSVEDAAEAVEEALDTCSQGLLLVVGQGMACMDNVMCLHEVFVMAYSKGEASVRLTLPDLGLEQTLALKRLCANIDVSKAGAGKPQDKTFILSEVRRRIGLKRTNLLLTQVLSNSLFCKLRWGGSLPHVASLAAALFKAGELCPLQLLLGGLEQLKRDDSSMADMKELFKSFDTDGSGELDESEFLLVLKTAGYSHDDALSSFHDINAAGDGQVTLQEFEAWWMQRHGEERPELTYPALWDKVKALAKLLGKQGLNEHAEFFRCASRQLEESVSVHPTRQALPAPSFKGDLQALLDSLSYKVHTEQLAACSLLYEFLLRNTELLHIDPATLPLAPKNTKAHDQPLLLALYMLTLVQLLEAYQLLEEKRGLVHFLLSSAAQLQADAAKDKRRPPERQRSGLPSSFAIAEILKTHSGASLVSKDQVAHFQKSISEFIAGSRAKATRRLSSMFTPQDAPSSTPNQDGGAAHGQKGGAVARPTAASVGPSLAALRAALLDSAPPQRLAAAAARPAAAAADLSVIVTRRESMQRCPSELPLALRDDGSPLACERSSKSSPNIAPLSDDAEPGRRDIGGGAADVPGAYVASASMPRRRSLLMAGSCSLKLQSMSEVLCRVQAGEEDETPHLSGASTDRLGRRPSYMARARRVSVMVAGRVSFLGAAPPPGPPPAAAPAADPLQRQVSQVMELQQQASPSPFSQGGGAAGAALPVDLPEPGAGQAPPAPLHRSRSHSINSSSLHPPPPPAFRLPSMRHCGSQLLISRAESSQTDAVYHPPGFPTLRLPDLRKQKAMNAAAAAIGEPRLSMG